MTTTDKYEGWLRTRPGEYALIRTPAPATAGAYSITEIMSEAGDGTHMHVHEREDEHVLVIEGTARIALADRVFEAAAGSSARLPRNVPHAWANPGPGILRMLMVCTPGGVEDALHAAAAGESLDLARLEEEYGVRIVGPGLV